MVKKYDSLNGLFVKVLCCLREQSLCTSLKRKLKASTIDIFSNILVESSNMYPNVEVQHMNLFRGPFHLAVRLLTYFLSEGDSATYFKEICIHGFVLLP